MNGRIKRLGQMTYGFIQGEDAAVYFFHDSDLVGEQDIELAVGDRVSFEVVEPQPAKGPRARDVSKLSTGNRNHAQEATQ